MCTQEYFKIKSICQLEGDKHRCLFTLLPQLCAASWDISWSMEDNGLVALRKQPELLTSVGAGVLSSLKKKKKKNNNRSKLNSQTKEQKKLPRLRVNLLRGYWRNCVFARRPGGTEQTGPSTKGNQAVILTGHLPKAVEPPPVYKTCTLCTLAVARRTGSFVLISSILKAVVNLERNWRREVWGSLMQQGSGESVFHCKVQWAHVKPGLGYCWCT